MSNLRDKFGEFCAALAESEEDELQDFYDCLNAIQDEDWGPGGEFAREMQPHIEFLIEERRRGF